MITSRHKSFTIKCNNDTDFTLFHIYIIIVDRMHYLDKSIFLSGYNYRRMGVYAISKEYDSGFARSFGMRYACLSAFSELSLSQVTQVLEEGSKT